MSCRDPIIAATTILAILPLAGLQVRADESPAQIDEAKLEADEVVIGKIVFEKQDVFDLENPKENNALYRLLNQLHIVTKDTTIEKQLLLKSGDRYSRRLSAESERILRANSYFYDVSITPKNRHDGTVDLHVNTRDVWTLQPALSISRTGGDNKTVVKLQESNLLGRGQRIFVAWSSDVDRDSTVVSFSDNHLGRDWMSISVGFADSSDGNTSLFSLVRPFYALDAKWTAGITAFEEDKRSTLYQLGEAVAEYRQEHRSYSAFGGWSAGLGDGWVRRYRAGFVFNDNQFSNVVDATLPPAIPDDRELAYPFFGIEILEDRFETASNRDQIEKTEDFLTGTRFTASLGWSDENFGADRDAVLYSLRTSRSFGKLAETALLLAAKASGRIEHGGTANALFHISARYYQQLSEKRTFFATFSGTHGRNLDLDNPVELGGDTGLRGYPSRYQSGDSKVLLTLEQRFFTDWYPFRLFRVGGAVFADLGRSWGDNPLGDEDHGWLGDVGVGLRFAPTRTGTGRILHLDVAFPLNGDDSIDSVQVLLESKKSF